MAPVTLESLAQRVAALERELAELRQTPPHSTGFKDWRASLRVTFNAEFQTEVDETGRRIRQSDDSEAPE